MASDLVAGRKVLVASIDELTEHARQEARLGRPTELYLHEIARRTLRLQLLQKEIEKHDY